MCFLEEKNRFGGLGVGFASLGIALRTIVNGINGYLNTPGSSSTRICFFLSSSHSVRKQISYLVQEVKNWTEYIFWLL